MGRIRLKEEEAYALLKSYGIPVAEARVAASADEAVSIARELGYPVVLKVVSPDILHKTEAGGVLLNLKGEKEVRGGYEQIHENARKYREGARLEGVLVQRQAPRGREVIIGAARDKQFGGVVMFGLGGVFVEVLKDVSFRIAPIDEREALRMIREIKGYPLLEEFRGQERADIETLAKVITAVSNLIQEERDIVEMDINPLMVYPRGALAVDVRVLKKG